jgi:hypothetical protein
LDDTFQDLVIDFTASVGSDHAGIWTTYQHILESAIDPPPQLSRFIIDDDACEKWTQQFLEVSPQIPLTLTTTTEIEQEAHQITKDIEQTSLQVFEA